MAGEQRCQGPPSPQPPAKNPGPASRTPEARSADPDWTLLLRGAGSRAGPPPGGAPGADAPPAPEDLSFQRGFPDPPGGFVASEYSSPHSPLPRVPPSGGRSPCTPGSYSVQAWPHPAAAFRVPPPEPEPFPYPFSAPHGAGPKPFSEGAAGRPCAPGNPLFTSPGTPGEWRDEEGGTNPACPLPVPPLCYPSLSSPQDLGGTDPEARAAPPAPSPFSGSRTFLQGLLGAPRGGQGQPPSSLPQGQFPGPGSLDLLSTGHPPARLPQLWGPAAPPYPPAAAGMVFLEEQPSLSQGPPLPWAQVLPPAGSGPQQVGVLSPPPFPPGPLEWPVGSQGALGESGPGGQLGALGTSPGQPGSSPRLSPYGGLKGLLLGAEQPQGSPPGPPLPPEVVADPSESPLPSPAAPRAGSSCSSLSPPAGSPANARSEDRQVPGSFHHSTHPQGAAPQLPDHFQPGPAFPGDMEGTPGAFGGLQTFPAEAPCSEQHFLDQLGVLLTCRQCDRNYGSITAFLGHRPFCSPLPARPKDAPPQFPGSPTPPATPKAPSDGVPGPFPLPGTGPALLAEGKEETLSAPFPPPATLDLDLEDAAKLDSLITEALHGLECQAHSPEIDSSFIDVFTDEESAGAGSREPQVPQPAVGSPPAGGRPQTRSQGPAEGCRQGPAGQQRRGKRFRLPVQGRGLAAVTTAQRPGRGSRGPCLRPRRKSRGGQAPGGRAGPRKVWRRAPGRTWAKDLAHKTVERRRLPGLPSPRPAARGPQGLDSGSEEDEDSESPRPCLSCPRAPRGEDRKELDSHPGPQAGGRQQRAREEGRPEGREPGRPCPGPRQRPEARGAAQGTAAPLPARGSAAPPRRSWPGPPCTSAPGGPAQKAPSPETTDEISQTRLPTPVAPGETPDTAGPRMSSRRPPGAPGPCTVASGLGSAPALGQPCHPPAGRPHQGPSTLSDWTPAQARSGGAAGALYTVGAGPGLAASASALGSPSSGLPGARPLPGPPPSPPLSGSGCAPGPGVPGQGQGEPQLDIRRPVDEPEGQLETSLGSPGAPGQPGGAAPSPRGPFLEVSLTGPGPEAATASMQVTLGSIRGESGGTVALSTTSQMGPPKAGGDWALPPRGLHTLLATGPRKPCRRRAGPGPEAPRPEAHLAPDSTFGGAGPLPQGRTQPRTSPLDGQAGVCPEPGPGGDLSPLPRLPAVGGENTPSSGGPPLSANTHRPSALRGRRVAQSDAPESAQPRPAGLMAGASPAQEELQCPPAPLQRAPCTPEPPPGPLPDSPSESQAWAWLEDKADTAQEDSPRGSPPSRAVSPGVAVPKRLDTVRAARLGPRAGQGTPSASPDTSGATHDVPAATPPQAPSVPRPHEDRAAFSCEVCSATFSSQPGLNRHRARRHGLCRATKTQLQDTPRRKSRLLPQKGGPGPDSGGAPSRELNASGLTTPGRSGKGGARARPGPSGRWAGGRAQRPGGEPPCILPTPDTSPSGPPAGSARSPGCPLLPGPEPGGHSSQPQGGVAPGPAAEVLEPGEGCGAGVARPGSAEGPQAKRRRGRKEPVSSHCRDPSRASQGPSQTPGRPPESLGTCGSEDGVQEPEDSLPDASSPGPGAPTRGDHSLPPLSPPGTPVCGKSQTRTQPPSPPEPHRELAGTWDPGTPGHLPTDLSGSALLCLSDAPILLDSGGPWDPHPGLWAQDLPENIPELHRVPAAWRGPLEETRPAQGGGSPGPPSLEPEPYPSLLPAAALDLQLLGVRLEGQDLRFLGAWEDAALLPALRGPEQGGAGPPAPPVPGPASQAGSGRAQQGAPTRAVCCPRFGGLGRPPAPPTCYMCVERRFSSGERLREHLRERHSQSRPGPWACGMCLREEADVWAYNAHLQAHAERSAHLRPAEGALGWEGHGPHCLDRPRGRQADGTLDQVSGPELPGGGGGPGALALAVHGGCRDETRDCHHCGKRFPKPFKLQRHLAVHSPLRVYLCPCCPRAYLQHGALRAHLGAVHGAWAEREVPPTALFSCELCADVACSGRRPLACSTCNLTFAKRDQLRRHLDKHRRRARLPAPLRRGRRPGAPRQDPPGCKGIRPGKQRRVAVPGGPPLPSPPQPLSPGGGSPTPRGDTCPDPPSARLDMATNPTEGPGEPGRAPPEPLPTAPDHDQGSCRRAGAPPSSRAEVPSSGSCPPAPQEAPLQPGPRRRRTERSERRPLPGAHRPPPAPSPCPGAPAAPQKPDSKCPPAPRGGSEGPCIKPGGCRGLSKDSLGAAATGKAPQCPAQHKKATGSAPPTGLGPPHSRGAGGSWPQPASGRLQSEAASTPTKADPAGQSPAPDRPPAEGCSRTPPGPGEVGNREERRKARAPSAPDKPPRAPRKQATPCRVLPTKGSKATRQAPEQRAVVPGEPRQRGLARAFPHAGPLHRRPKRSSGGPAVAAASPHACRTAESQSELLSQLFGPRLSRFKIPLKKGPSA